MSIEQAREELAVMVMAAVDPGRLAFTAGEIMESADQYAMDVLDALAPFQGPSGWQGFDKVRAQINALAAPQPPQAPPEEEGEG